MQENVPMARILIVDDDTLVLAWNANHMIW
jgi:hypothetical protein